MLRQVPGEQQHCYHCGLPVGAGAAFVGELEGRDQVFCCPACRLVAHTIHDSGLGNFYRHRDPAGGRVDAQLVEADYRSFDDADFQQRYVSVARDDAGIAAVTLLIGGIHCAACVWLLEKYLTAIPAVVAVDVSLNEQVARIRWHRDRVPLSALCRAIARLGYEPEIYTPDQQARLQQREHHQALRRLGVAGLAMMQVGMFAIALYAGALQGIEPVYRDYLRWISLLVATPVVLYSARPFFVGAWRGLSTRTPGMDLPVAIAIGLAYLASLRATVSGQGEVYFDSVAMFTFLLLGGRYLEMRARHRGNRVSSDLNSLLPVSVTRVDGGGDEPERRVVPLAQLAVGDRVLVKPGQVIPVDGVVVAGHGGVSEAQLTGEFMPITRAVGDEVVAGAVNQDGVLTVEARRVGAELKLQAINSLLQRARTAKPRVAQLADRYASVFVTGVLLLAAGTYGYWHWVDGGDHAARAFWVTLSVLVVSCPCALSLATPAAITAATNRLRQWGLLVSNPQVWESAAGITDVVCDKTGTLTRGEVSLGTVVPVAGETAEHCLTLAAALEQHSEHAIARAFAGTPSGLAVEAVEVAVGEGIEGRVDERRLRVGSADYAGGLCDRVPAPPDSTGHWVLLAGEEGPLCWFRLQDRLRADAEAFVAAMRRRGLRTHLLSGDSSGAAEQLGRQLNFDQCRAGVSPGAKLDYVSSLQAAGARVLMLGDGINDIAVLAAADIAVALSNASDLAKTQSDAVSLSGQLLAVERLLELAVQTRRVIRQNLAWALAYNLTAIPLAAMAWVPPYLAALGMSVSSLVVVVNALRLQRASPDNRQPAVRRASGVTA